MTENRQCSRCGAELNPRRIVWLELDSRTNLFHEPGKLPEGGVSQGAFAFGPDCAREALKKNETKVGAK